MALKKCKECGKEVSTKAEKCPHCGVRNPTTSTMEGCLGNFLSLVILGVIIFIIVHFVSGGGNSDSNKHKKKTIHKTALTIPNFKVINEDVHDVPLKTQVEQRIFVKDHIKPNNLNALLKEQYKKIENRRGFKYHNKPTSVYIYLFDSRDAAKAKGRTDWVAALMKSSADNSPRIKIRKKLIHLHKQPSKTKFGLTESKRKQIFKQIVKAEDRADHESRNKKPNDLKEQASLSNKLAKTYVLQVANNFGISMAQIDSIKIEALKKHWPFPPYN
jgi:hypothetical protein